MKGAGCETMTVRKGRWFWLAACRARRGRVTPPTHKLLKLRELRRRRPAPGGIAAMHGIWKDMFVITLPILEKILRPVIVNFFLVIMLRLAGKRELVQLNPFDLVVLLTLSNTVQNAIIGDDNSVSGGILGATSLLTVNYLVVRFLYGHKRIDQFGEGNADVLIENGSVRLDRLKKELISPTQLEAAARKQGFESLNDVQKCILEPG